MLVKRNHLPSYHVSKIESLFMYYCMVVVTSVIFCDNYKSDIIRFIAELFYQDWPGKIISTSVLSLRNRLIGGPSRPTFKTCSRHVGSVCYGDRRQTYHSGF